MQAETERRLRKAGQAVSKSLAERDLAIAQASEEGASLREIAKVVGLSHVGVKKVMERLPRP